MPAGAYETNPRGGVIFQVLGSRVRSRLIPAVRLRAALAQMAPLCLILQVVFFQPNLVVAKEDISSRVPALIEALKDTDRDDREQAARVLGQIGPDPLAARAVFDVVDLDVDRSAIPKIEFHQVLHGCTTPYSYILLYTEPFP